MIRPISLCDVDYFVEQGKAYLAESGDTRFFDVDEDHFRQRLIAAINAPTTIGFICPGRGHIVATVAPPMWSGERAVARVFTWWVIPAWRGTLIAARLLRTLERNVSGLILIDAHHRLSPDKVGALYVRQGYEPIQTLYAKVV